MKNILALFGGNSVEKDISVITAIEAIGRLDRDKYKVYPVFISDKWYLGDYEEVGQFCPFRAERYTHVALVDSVLCEVKGGKLKKLVKPDCALLLTHGGDGENGSLQGLLECHGLPYTSSGVLASAVGMDKIISKQAFENLILNVPKYLTICKIDYEKSPEKTAHYIETFLDYPLVVKPSSQGSSIGINSVNCREELFRAFDVAFCFGDKVIAERKIINFIEINCACVRRNGEIIVSEVERPISSGDILSFEDKYVGGEKTARQLPADIEKGTASLIRAQSKRIYCELDLMGVVRFDYLLTEDMKKVYINEMNTIPGSLANYLFEPLGIDYGTLLDIIIEEAIRQKKPPIKFESRVLEYFSGEKVSLKN